jgi:hypothetical protein
MTLRKLCSTRMPSNAKQALPYHDRMMISAHKVQGRKNPWRPLACCCYNGLRGKPIPYPQLLGARWGP